jgi:hypothetical protein
MKAAFVGVLALLATGALGCGGAHRHIATAPMLLTRAPPLPSHVELTKNIPCFGEHHPLISRQTLSRFHAVTALSCTEGTRIYPGRGQWAVLIRRISVGSVAGLQRYFEQPDAPNLPKHGGCTQNLVGVLVPVLVDAKGRWLVPQTPRDGCGHPLGYVYGKGEPRLHWRVVSVRKETLMVSASALAAHCSMGIKDLPGGGIGQLDPSSGGRLFKSAPKTMRVCIYRTPTNDFGNFVRGFALSAVQTRRLLRAMTGAGRSGSCPNERTFAVIGATSERWAEVELGGCWRVGRTYPEYAIGSADATVVRAILG